MKIVNNLILAMFLFSLMGCTRSWRLEVANKLSYPIYAIVIFSPYDKNYIGPIQSGESAIESDLFVSQTVSAKAHEEIQKISIFSEDKIPLMILHGKGMDKYVIFMGKGRLNDYNFRLEVKEDLIGTGLNKGINFEEEREEAYIENINVDLNENMQFAE
jgi:hypothetical protein